MNTSMIILALIIIALLVVSKAISDITGSDEAPPVMTEASDVEQPIAKKSEPDLSEASEWTDTLQHVLIALVLIGIGLW